LDRLFLAESFSAPSRLKWDTDATRSELKFLQRRHAVSSAKDRSGRYLEEDDYEDDYDDYYAGYEAAAVGEDVDWVRPPTKQHWCYRDICRAWGNEPMKVTWYVAAALIVEVPAYGTGVRAAVA
jgi:hypothetical protein